MALHEIRKELTSLIKDIKIRIEMEKTFGVDTCLHTNRERQKGESLSSSKSKVTPEAPKPDTQNMINEKEKRTRLLDGLKNEMLTCHKCPLGNTRTNLVFGVGNPMADLMFVGEAPGRDEDLQGEPFVGRAGQLLTKIINAIGLKRSEVYIGNILKCRPPGNRNPLPEEISLCIPYLKKQINIIQPKILCTLGSFAAQTLLNTKTPVGALRGKFHDYNGIPTMVTFHPAYLLRNPAEKAKVWEDMKKVRDFLKEHQGA